jgi:hypothetical protein
MDTPCSSPFLSRRDLLVSTGSAAIVAPLLLGIGTASAATGAGAAAASRIDFTDPAQNLRAFMRLTADLDPNKESTGWFGGHIFAVVDGKPLQMLCGVEGFGVMRVAPQKDGTYRVFNRELAFYKDPKTDEFVDEWTNPLTGEKCEVSPIHNRTVTATVAPIVRQDFDGHIVERPFNPSWTLLDGQAFQVFEGDGVAARIVRPDLQDQRDFPAHMPQRRSRQLCADLSPKHGHLDTRRPLAAMDADGPGARAHSLSHVHQETWHLGQIADGASGAHQGAVPGVPARSRR